MVLVTTAECDKSRFAIAAIARLRDALVNHGIAFRAVVRSAAMPTRQYARLLPDPAAVVAADTAGAFDALKVRSVPTLFLIDAAGRVRTRSSVPVHTDELLKLTRHLATYSPADNSAR